MGLFIAVELSLMFPVSRDRVFGDWQNTPRCCPDASDIEWLAMMLEITPMGRKLQGRYGYLAANPAVWHHGALTGLL